MIMPDNGQTKVGLEYFFRIGEECEVAYANYN